MSADKFFEREHAVEVEISRRLTDLSNLRIKDQASYDAFNNVLTEIKTAVVLAQGDLELLRYHGGIE
jgi:hypothetical protein